MNMILRLALVVFLILAASQSVAQDVACGACHTEQTAGEIHQPAKVSCQACHGEGKMHPGNPTTGVVRFDEEPADVRSAACTGCHSDAHGDKRKTFISAGKGCNDCHSIHDDASALLDNVRSIPSSLQAHHVDDAPAAIGDVPDNDATDTSRVAATRDAASNYRLHQAASRFLLAESVE